MTTAQALALPDHRQRRRQLFHNFLAAWSLYPGDERVKLTSRKGRLLSYPINPETKQGELLCERPSFQTRREQQRALVTPNVCTALPLAGGALVATVIRFR